MLHVLHAWPAPRKAVRLILTGHAETDGNLYWLLDPVARWLEGADPLAATLLRRAMIEDALSLAPLVGDYGQFETHAAFLARRRAKHGYKTGFGPC